MRIAARVNGVIVNADSAQVYTDLRVVSARPSQEDERALPHRLFGYIDGAEACSAATWARDAKTALADIHAEGRTPVLVGGTGLYQRTLLDGIAPIPEIDSAVRAAVRALPVAQAYAALKREDPMAAARLAAADTTRVARALEVVRSTGTPIGEWRQRKSGGIAKAIDLVPCVLLPDRDWLYERCDRRFAAMFDEGAVAEVEALLARGLDPALPVMRAIGVREIAAYLDGELGRDEAIAAAALATRRYAKRQYTWFAHQSPADWPRINETEYDENSDSIVTKLR